MSHSLSAALYSTFNVTQLARLLHNDGSAPAVRVDHVHGLLSGGSLSRAGAMPAAKADVAVVVTTPEAVLPSVARLLQGFACDSAALHQEAAAFAGSVEATGARIVLVPSWIAPARYAGGLLALDRRYGLEGALADANHALVEAAAGRAAVRVLNAAAWQVALGARAFSAKNWYLTKDPYSFELYKHAVWDLKTALLALLGRAKKLLIVDLDNTLWGGEVGDVGLEGLQLGGHDAVGEAHADFQRELLALGRRGVVLAVASKNDEHVALGAIDGHPEQVLRREHFAGWIIDWNDKAQNVRTLCERLGIAPRDAVLIDDSPVERAAVAAAIPEIMVPPWPANPMLFVEALRRLAVFDVPDVTAEDLGRGPGYAAARRAPAGAQLVETRIEVRSPEAPDALRVTQLLNKTNQVNLTTRRFTEAELRDVLRDQRVAAKVARVSDAFADYGLTGVLLLRFDGATCTITDFVMSCRVMARGVEERMLLAAHEEAAARGCSEIVADFVPTERNEPMRRFLVERSGMRTEDGRHFSSSVRDGILAPA